MADKPFGIEELKIIGSGTPTISSPGDLDIDANLVNISDDLTAVGDITAAYFYGDGSNLTNVTASSVGSIDVTANITIPGNSGEVLFNNNSSLGAASKLFYDSALNRVGVNTIEPQYQFEVRGDTNIEGALTVSGQFTIDDTNQRVGIGIDPTDTNNFYTATSLEVPLIIKAKDSNGAAGSSSAIQFIQSDGEENASRFIFVNNDLTRAAEIYSTHNTISAADSRNNLIFTVYGSSTESLNFRSSTTTKAFYPTNDGTIDLGISNSNEFKDIYFTGSLYQNGTAINSANVLNEVHWVKNNSGIHTLANVGIGTTNPTVQLDVAGNAKFKNSEINFNDFCIIGTGTQEWYIPDGYERQLSPQVGTAITSGGLLGSNPTRTTDAEIYDHCWDNYDDFDLDGDGIVSFVDILMLLRWAGDSTIALQSVYNSVWSDFATRNTDSEIKSFIQSNLSTYDVTGNGTFDVYTDMLIILRVFGATQGPPGGTTPEAYEAFDFSNDSFLDPDDGGVAQFRINRTVGIGTTTLSNTETRVLDVYGKVSIADTTSNAGGARYISTEAPTAGVGQEGDIWYDVSSTADTAGTNGNIPIGGIIMWYGTIANIPASWALCDGTSYSTAIGTIQTPDLRGQFVVGAADDTIEGTFSNNVGVGSTGGSKDAVVVSHSHSLNTYGGAGSSGPAGAQVNPGGSQSQYNLTTTTETEGVSGTNANLPPYYALAYIMRIA